MNQVHTKAANSRVKAKTSEKADKNEFKTYVKAMHKTGLPGSRWDDSNKGKSTELYNDLTVRKGKQYADRVYAVNSNKAISTIQISSMISGAVLASMYYSWKLRDLI